MTEIVLPIKTLPLAKSRLAGLLPGHLRAGLVLAMLEDLVCALKEVEHNRIWVVSNDDLVRKVARRFEVNFLHEEPVSGYNAAARLGLSVIADDRPVAILPGDVPLTTSSELARLITPANPGQAVIRLAPSHDRRGTNGLFMSSKRLLRPAYGANSFFGYCRSAVTAGFPPQILELPGLARDIDLPSDLQHFASEPPAGATFDFLDRIGIHTRLSPAKQETAA